MSPAKQGGTNNRDKSEKNNAEHSTGHIHLTPLSARLRSPKIEDSPVTGKKRFKKSEEFAQSSSNVEEDLPRKENGQSKVSPKSFAKTQGALDNDFTHFTTEEVMASISNCMAESIKKIEATCLAKRERQRDAELLKIADLRKELVDKTLRVKRLVEVLTKLEVEHDDLQNQIQCIKKMTVYND